MNKKATKTITPIKTGKRTIIAPIPSGGVTNDGIESSMSEAVKALANHMQTRQFNTEEEAINFLISSVTAKLAEDPTTQGQMKEFLELLVETDPELKQEIVHAIKTRE